MDKVIEYLKSHLDVRDRQKQRLGEVFTSLELVDEMLARLPASIWRDPKCAWLDPAAGIGNFLLKAFIGGTGYVGLMEGLKAAIPDAGARAEHIVTKMLYFVDINEGNNKVVRRLLDQLAPGARPNVEAVDRRLGFLSPQLPAGWPSKYDVIVGNPPYQLGRVKVARFTLKAKAAQKASGAAAKTESVFWAKFVTASLKLLKSGGYLLFVHPITWFKKDRLGIHDLLLSKQLEVIKVFRNFEARKYFGGGAGIIHVAYYLLKNSAPHTKTLIEYAGSERSDKIMLGPDVTLALNFNGILDKLRRRGVKTLGEAEDLELRHKVVGGRAGTQKLIRILSEDGTGKFVVGGPHPNAGKQKLIVGGIHRPVLYFDKSGKYGLLAQGQRHYFLGSETALEGLADTFKLRLMSLLLDNIKYEQDFIRPGFLPDLRGLKVRTDAELAAWLGLTAEEKAAVAAAAPTAIVGRLAFNQDY
jgi:hypothetical protein